MVDVPILQEVSLVCAHLGSMYLQMVLSVLTMMSALKLVCAPMVSALIWMEASSANARADLNYHRLDSLVSMSMNVMRIQEFV